MCEIGEACLGEKIRTRDIYTSKQKLKRNVCYILSRQTLENLLRCNVLLQLWHILQRHFEIRV